MSDRKGRALYNLGDELRKDLPDGSFRSAFSIRPWWDSAVGSDAVLDERPAHAECVFRLPREAPGDHFLLQVLEERGDELGDSVIVGIC